MYIVLDTETTGHAEDPGMIQLSVYNPNGEHFDEKCAPTKPILPAAIAVHGITNEEAATFQPRRALQLKFQQYIQTLPPGVVVVGQNIKYDTDVMENNINWSPANVLDTWRIAKKLIKHEDIGAYKLDALFVYLYPDRVKELIARRATHDALEDCKLTDEVYTALIARMLQTEPEQPTDAISMMRWAQAPMYVHSWGFGKHKGKPLDHDWGYVGWYLKQADRDPDIVYTVGLLKEQQRQARR